MSRQECHVLERAVATLSEQAAKAEELVDEAKAAGGGDHPVTVHAKMLRLELLKMKADLERELEGVVLNCSNCGLDVHWVSALGVSPGHWAHREPRRMATLLLEVLHDTGILVRESVGSAKLSSQ